MFVRNGNENVTDKHPSNRRRSTWLDSHHYNVDALETNRHANLPARLCGVTGPETSARR
jgi:hypothetical protein